jgi:hypothetical protein
MSNVRAGEHRHVVGSKLRALIPHRQLQVGQLAYVVPRAAGVPRGAPIGGRPLGFIAQGGAELRITDYLLGCAQRGEILCYERDGEDVSEGESEEKGEE